MALPFGQRLGYALRAFGGEQVGQEMQQRMLRNQLMRDIAPAMETFREGQPERLTTAVAGDPLAARLGQPEDPMQQQLSALGLQPDLSVGAQAPARPQALEDVVSQEAIQPRITPARVLIHFQRL